MSDRFAVMRHGKIEQLGAPEDVYENPATEFVAGFLGASNLLDGELAGDTDGMSTIKLKAGSSIHAPARPLPSPIAVCTGLLPRGLLSPTRSATKSRSSP